MSDYGTIEGVTITHHPAEDGKSGEYRAQIEGSDAVGRLTWKARDGARLVDHTLVPREIGGRGGLDPVRYGDWEKNGRCIDF